MNTNHYPNIELCRELTNIGFPETEKVFAKLVQFKKEDPEHEISDRFQMIGECVWDYICPSVMEMLDVMPTYIKEKDDNFLLDIWGVGREPREFGVVYKTVYRKEKKWFQNEHLPNALAEMILWLHEKNYISFSK